MPCDFPLAVVFATSTSGHFVKLKIYKIFQVYKRTEFNKTIIPFALVGYENGHSQRILWSKDDSSHCENSPSF